jgi:hypothetical protein
MKLLYIYALLIFATKIAVADNFNDLWKKHGGEVLSGNKNNSITQPKSKISTTDNDFISFISTANNASLKIDLKGGLIRFENFPKASKSKYFKYYEQILEKILIGKQQFYYAVKITNNKKDNAKDSFNWTNASVSADSKALIINDNKLYENKEFLKEGTYMLFAIRYDAWYGSTFFWKNNLNYMLLKKQLKKLKRENNKTVIASKPTILSAELDASKREANELRKKLLALENKQKQKQQRIDTDTRGPLLEIISVETIGKRGTITGIARDNIEVTEVTIDGKPISFSSNGNFKYSTYVPPTGLELSVQVTDVAGLTTSKTVILKADTLIANASISFERLNPLGKRVRNNKNALALIVGVSNYENTKAKALYADNDAMLFKDYATEKLGISKNRIKILLNDGADERDILLTVREWLRRSAKPNQSDIYVFFAGHGLASDNGKDMYLLPHDGSPRLLEKTAILRNELFSDIKEANPKSVTIFLDTCYSGVTRNDEMLIAGRPIVIKAKEQAIPDGFTLFSAASNEQISRPLEEAKHGMFSYFLMKGMEGDADTNADNKITARELHI